MKSANGEKLKGEAMSKWQSKPDILQLRAYACEVVVSQIVAGKDMKAYCERLMNQYAFGDEKGFRNAAQAIIKQVL